LMTENATVTAQVEDRNLSDADLETITGGQVEQGGAWRQGSKGNWVYEGWAKEGSKSETYTSSTRREYAEGGKINLYNHDNKLLKTYDGAF